MGAEERAREIASDIADYGDCVCGPDVHRHLERKGWEHDCSLFHQAQARISAALTARENDIRREMLDELLDALRISKHARPDSPSEVWRSALQQVTAREAAVWERAIRLTCTPCSLGEVPEEHCGGWYHHRRIGSGHCAASALRAARDESECLCKRNPTTAARLSVFCPVHDDPCGVGGV
jgi:hypothetical protein